MASSQYTLPVSRPAPIGYSSIEPLYQGTMFTISTALRDGRRWLLKSVAPTAKGEQEQLRSLLQRELAILQQLDSPFILRAHELVEIPSLGLCLVEEYIDGVTLDEWLMTRPASSQRYQVLIELLEAVAYLHTKQIVHGDLKPKNILITHNGHHVKLIDFGLSDEDGSIYKNLGCTYPYAAPEQTTGQPTDCQADIYALGHLLTLLFSHRYGMIRRRCLREDPTQRYPSVAVLRQAMNCRQWALRIVLIMISCVALIWGAYQWQVYQTQRQAQQVQRQAQQAQQQEQAVLDHLHLRYDSICNVYRDSVQGSPQNSLRLRYYAMQHICDLHTEAMQQDSVHARAIEEDYISVYSYYLNQLNTTTNEY